MNAATRNRALGGSVAVMCLAFLLAIPAAARAHGVRSHHASPPTKGALYLDGSTERYLLGGRWLYRPDYADAGSAQGWWKGPPGTRGWRTVTVPNAFNAGDLSQQSWDGYVGWYRRDFTLPQRAFAAGVPRALRRWIIRFESVSYRMSVWCNGHEIGSHTGANLPFEFGLTGLRRGTNRLIVRVDTRHLPGELPPGAGGGWWNYGGLLREVYLRPVARVDIQHVSVRTVLPCPRCAATIHERVLLRNVTDRAQRVKLAGRYGGARLNFAATMLGPRATLEVMRSVRVAHPRLWSPQHPSLYDAKLRLSDSAGVRLGGYRLLSGIRTIKVNRAGRLTLNGRLLNLRGVEMREQDIRVGAALDRQHLRRLVGWVRALGATLIRSDPLNPQIEELADREGLLIWSDIPIGGHVDAISRTDALLADNVQANENHPSVIVWGIADELQTPATAGEAAYIASAVATAHRLDPMRPAGMAVSDWPGVKCQAAYAPLDVIGVNEYFGWYDAGGGTTDDRDALSPFLDSLRACYPTKALFITEFGFDGARSGPVDVRGTYAFQANAAGYHLGVFASKPWLSGAVYFLLQDSVSGPRYTGGDPNPYPPFNLKGLRNVFGLQKPAWGVVSYWFHHTRQVGAPRLH